jgi:potassium-transporting ATPase KdpC subunit
MKDLRKGLRLLVWMTVLTGIAYPLGITFLGGLLFREKSGGSLVSEREKILGSKWIGQIFSNPAYFWPRPSATNYELLPSGGSNLSVTHRDFQRRVVERRERLKVADPPPDLLYASGSGLDPHISPEAALIQIGRVAHARGTAPAGLRILRESMVEPPTFGVLGEPRVNVLFLNMELDRKFPRTGK